MPEINDDVQAALMRYVEYHWSWNLAGKLLRRKFGIEFKVLYANLTKEQSRHP